MKKIVIILALTGFTLVTGRAQTAPAVQEIENVLGRKGSVQQDVVRFTFPRSDLHVTVGGVAVEPALALTSWIAFRSMGDRAMMMGDLVLLDAEVGSVEKQLVAGGIEVSAVHNHIINESPAVKYLHFGATGDAVKLAESMKAVLGATATPAAAAAPSQPPAAADWSKVEAILGRSGHQSGNVFQIGVPRAETITEGGMEIPPSMGMMTSMNFQRAGEKAATTGDFVLLADEVNPVISALTAAGITVTAVHNHMLHESPRLFFLHFWGYDAPEALAAGLRSALDKTHSAGTNR